MKKKLALFAFALAPMFAVAAEPTTAPKAKIEAVDTTKEAKPVVELPAEDPAVMKKRKTAWLAFQDKRLPVERDMVHCVRKADTLEKEQKCFTDIGSKLGQLQQEFMAEMEKLAPKPAAAPQAEKAKSK